MLRSNPWGVIVGTIVNVKAAIYMVALAAATWTAGGAAAQIGLWVFLGTGCLLTAVGLLRAVANRRS